MTRIATMPAVVRGGMAAGTLVAALLLGSPSARAQAEPGDVDGVTGRLIELLVKKGVLPRDEANALLAEAKAERAKIAKPAAPPVAPTALGPKAAKPPEEPVPPGTVRVTYVPRIVRDQIAEQVRSDLLLAAKNGGWAQPDQTSAAPDRFHFFGDLRLRGELDRLPDSNAPQFPDFATIDSGSPYDITGASGFVPLLDTTHDRSRVRLRARVGVDAQIDDGISAEIRIASGNDASPVSANQTLGQNGPFAKYAVWLDRAFVKAAPVDWLTAYAGRMSNPYWTTDLIYYDDLAFDGFAASATPRFGKDWKGFFTAGAFPVFNTAFNFGSTSVDSSYASENAWLFALQAGGEWRASEQISTKFAAGYFSYSDISGKISSPCTIVFSSDTCDTDATRTLFPGTGNTMIPLRNLVLASPTSTQPQYFGLASPFRIVDLHGRVDLANFKPVIVSFETEFAVNVAFDRNRAVALGFNNFGASGLPDVGNKAWMVKVNVGTPEIAARWDWNVSLAYKYLESDSVLASLNDPDFHLGGTNAKGFILAGNLGVARNTWFTARWLSSTQVSGSPYEVDVFQADLNVRF
jgi:hypothetical protein